MISIRVIVLIVALAITNVFAFQNKVQKTIQYKDSEEIVRVKSSENYILTRIYDHDF